ncbi:hypothetical protein BCR33DRAFT_715546 [Rhizoclosmatium globosum]|uniref:RED-like N-terminal domain-containing protein n=1 Tax=Rhizoclosmatium globosum TaxID=329046 RepID=A0A1Y2CHF2_9FUNG|nr:hypothetical protein BCR33DRAFT_715546 [Rhizoclosmatium globosum]|eukprot:ORY46473.1 hypothetical protein BCR33DRAFT_715546 [Rhizoclosmatium globosum]
MSSLSQDDFRKLLQTPRAPSASDTKPKEAKFAKPHPKKPASEFARPVPRKFQKKQEANTDQNADDSGSKFRDRASERRQGINPDYKDSEDILARLTAAEEKEGDIKDIKSVIYEQSKYLGGDVTHTHLVKGLDFALLKKVRSELQKDHKTEEQEAEDFLDSVADTSKATPASATAPIEPPRFLSSFAERIHAAAFLSKTSLPPKNELFREGRMAFCWDLRGGDDIPTNIIRSKADIKDEMKSSTADSEVVIGKIVEILASVRFGTRTKEGMTVGEKKALKKKEREEKEAAEQKKRELESGMDIEGAIIEDDGEDIFAEAGRDYSLEVVDKSTGERFKAMPQKPETAGSGPIKPTSYFAKPVIESDDEGDSTSVMDIVPASMSQENEDDDDMFADLDETSKPKSKTTTVSTSATPANAALSSLLSTSAAMLNTLQGAGTAEKLLTQEHHALAKTKKPAGLSLSRLASNYGEEDPEFDRYYDSDDQDEEEEAAADASQLDLGIKNRKKTQMKRYDFETEEEFQAYKESQVVMPKSAFQFGVKSSDGRKNRKEMQASRGAGSSSGNQDQKLDKEMKQLDKMMGEKYGMSITKNDKKRESKGSGGGPTQKRRI